jgi:hypothetical protein
VSLIHLSCCPVCRTGLRRRCHWCTRWRPLARFLDERTCEDCAAPGGRAPDGAVPPPPPASATTPPPDGRRVVLVDASFSEGVAGLAVVGALGRHSRREELPSSVVAERRALAWAMDIARDLGERERDLVFRTDCSSIVAHARRNASRRWTVEHVPRSGVREAHLLAGRARRGAAPDTAEHQPTS